MNVSSTESAKRVVNVKLKWISKNWIWLYRTREFNDIHTGLLLNTIELRRLGVAFNEYLRHIFCEEVLIFPADTQRWNSGVNVDVETMWRRCFTHRWSSGVNVVSASRRWNNVDAVVSTLCDADVETTLTPLFQRCVSARWTSLFRAM